MVGIRFIVSGLMLLGASTFAQVGTLNPPRHAQGALGAGVPSLWVRPGYKVTVAAENVAESRFMVFDDKGTLYVSMPGRGKIVSYRLKVGKYEPVGDFVSGYPTVHGLDFRDGWVWFTQSKAIHKARDTNGDGIADEVVHVIPEGTLPGGTGHWWRSICVVSDGFFTSVGDPGNIDDQTNSEREKIWKYTLDGKQKTLWSSGIRNTEKLRVRAGSLDLWGADHGSDWFGGPLGDKEGNQPVTDWNPPCEFNRYTKDGFYGHPFVVGNRVPRIEYQNRKDILELAAQTIPPAWSLGAHWAPNGWTFLTQPGLGPNTVGDALVACHGSWNRSVKSGYRVERILFDSVTGEPYGSLMLVGCLSPTGEVLARPVDVVEAPDGSVLFSDDFGRRIYRISRA